MVNKMRKNKISEPSYPKNNSIEIVQHSGPLPAPQILAEYKKCAADAPERIIKMAEEEQRNRLEMKNREIDNIHKLRNEQSNRENKAQFFTFLIISILILGSFFLIYNDKSISGFITFGTTIIAVGIGYLTKNKNK